MVSYGNFYNADISTAFDKEVNILPAIRTEIAEWFDTEIVEGREASIVSVSMQSASAFTVSFNAENLMTAQLLSNGLYGVEFSGTISYIVFDDDTTLTFFRVEWFADRKNHSTIELATEPSTGVTVTVYDILGNVIPPASDGTYDLIVGAYRYLAEHTDYNDISDLFFVLGVDESVPIVFKEAAKYTITFATTPTAAAVEVRDSDDNVVPPQSGKIYLLGGSSVVGEYSYTVSAAGYISKTGTLDVQANATETVALIALSSIAITAPPTKTSYAVGEAFSPVGMVVTATYGDSTAAIVTNYTWTPTTPLVVTDTEVTVSYTAGEVTKTAAQTIVVT